MRGPSLACFFIPSNLRLCSSFHFLMFDSFWNFQALFFLINAGLFPRAEVDLDEHVSKPRSRARAPKPMKEAYSVNSLSDALFEFIISDNIATCNPQTTNVSFLLTSMARSKTNITPPSSLKQVSLIKINSTWSNSCKKTVFRASTK